MTWGVGGFAITDAVESGVLSMPMYEIGGAHGGGAECEERLPRVGEDCDDACFAADIIGFGDEIMGRVAETVLSRSCERRELFDVSRSCERETA